MNMNEATRIAIAVSDLAESATELELPTTTMLLHCKDLIELSPKVAEMLEFTEDGLGKDTLRAWGLIPATPVAESEECGE
jgi:hypothetical protein